MLTAWAVGINTTGTLQGFSNWEIWHFFVYHVQKESCCTSIWKFRSISSSKNLSSINSPLFSYLIRQTYLLDQQVKKTVHSWGFLSSFIPLLPEFDFFPLPAGLQCHTGRDTAARTGSPQLLSLQPMLYCSRPILNSQDTNLGWGADLQKNAMPWHNPGHQGSLNAFATIIYDWQKGEKKEKSVRRKLLVLILTFSDINPFIFHPSGIFQG